MSEMHNPSTDVIEETKSTHRQCKICGTQALHSNFGAITCSACKVFFKRNGETGSVSTTQC
jgi:ribosomal protein L37E